MKTIELNEKVRKLLAIYLLTLFFAFIYTPWRTHHIKYSNLSDPIGYHFIWQSPDPLSIDGSWAGTAKIDIKKLSIEILAITAFLGFLLLIASHSNPEQEKKIFSSFKLTKEKIKILSYFTFSVIILFLGFYQYKQYHYDYLLKKSDEFISQNNIIKADSLLTNAISLNPHKSLAYFKKAALAQNSSDYNTALINYGKAKSLGDNNQDLYLEIARCCSLLGYSDKALININKALINSPDIETYCIKAVILLSQDNYPKALAATNAAIRLEPKNERETYWKIKAYTVNGDIYRTTYFQYQNFNDPYNQALDSYNKALLLCGNSNNYPEPKADVYIALGYLYNLNNQETKAIKYFKSGVEMFPEKIAEIPLYYASSMPKLQ